MKTVMLVCAALGMMGCATETTRAHLEFAVTAPGRACSVEQVSVVGKAKHDKDVGMVRAGITHPATRIEGNWVTVDGTSVEAPRSVQWAGAVRDQDRTAIAIVSDSVLYAGTTNGGPIDLHELGAVDTNDSKPDLALQDGELAIAWETTKSAHFAQMTNGSWHKRELATHAMNPRVSAIGNGAFMVVWREGGVEHHTLRAQVHVGGEPAGAPLAITGDRETIRAEVASTSDGRAVVSAIVEDNDLLVARVSCN